jgi:nitrite reductase/ring-hydroxylating ferredoxin subunit
MTWVSLGPVGELHFADGATVKVGERELAVFRLADGYAVFENSCPHAGGPLAEGYVDDGRVTCPWHAWSFDLRTGVCTTMPGKSATRHASRLVDGRLEVDLE